MKIFTKIWKIIAIGVIITAGLMGCKSTPVVMDEATLAKYENASWVVIPLAGNPLSLEGFQIIGKDEIIYFQNIPVTEDFEDNKYYALTAPEFPDTYYYLRYGLVLFQGRTLSGNKSTTIDEDTFAERNAYTNNFHSASWEFKELSSEPSLDGFKKLSLFDTEAGALPLPMDLENNVWYEVTAPELPGVTFLCNKSGGGAASVTDVYKREN